jgi:hypothetical protein
MTSCASHYTIEIATMFVVVLFTITQPWNQPRHPITNECIKKIWYIDTMEYYSSIKENEIMAFAEKWMKLKIIMLSKISQAQKDKYHMFYSYAESKTN